MFKIESFTNNVYDGELEETYATIAEARVAMKTDSEIYNVKHCMYLISHDGRMVEIWEVRFGEFTKTKDYLAGQ